MHLKVLYQFSPLCITIDYDMSQIKALKTCEAFIKKPYIICCLFHFTQAIIRKMKKYNLVKKHFSKRSYEILRN